MILEEINRAGANSGACHAQMYIMGTLLRHGSVEQKQRYLPGIASGALRLQSFAVTEPTTKVSAAIDVANTMAISTGVMSYLDRQDLLEPQEAEERHDSARESEP